jgi:DNA primase
MAVDVVQEIKLRTDLVELISQYVPLRRSGRTHKGLCPFHGEKTPSFHVDGERGFFKCYGCGVGGDCFTFIQQKEGLSFAEAGELLARRLGLEWVRRGETAERRPQWHPLYDLNALVERFYRNCLKETPEVRAYLEQRGLAPETVEEFRLGYAPPGWETLLQWLRREKISLEDAEAADVVLKSDENRYRDRFVDRLIFPIFDIEGRTVAFGGRTLKADGIPKYLNTKETPVFQKGKTLYGLHVAKRAIPDSGFAVAVEGYMDLIALHQAGIANAVACLGTAITETHVGILRRYSPNLVLCFDGDSAGMRAALRSSAMFEAAGCQVRVARLPEEDDPDTFLRRRGADEFRALLNRAEPLLDYQLHELRGRYNLSDQAQRLPFVREAARIVAASGSHLTRQEYAGKLTAVVDRLADEWYPGNPQQAVQARVALGQEISRLLRQDRMNARPGAAAPRPAAEAPNAQARAERYVLRAALSEPRWAERVAAAAHAGCFADPRLQRIAGTLLGNNGSERPTDVEARAETIRADPASAALVSELLMHEEPLSDEGLEECLLFLDREWKQRRKLELLRVQSAGELAADDPRRTELLRLLTELGGRQRRED